MISCPVEGHKCRIAIDVPLRPSISLKLGTVPLPLRLDEAAMCAQSEWPPCGPGHYELFLACGDIQEHRTITVMPQHFTESDFTSMLHELTELLPKSIALQLLKCGGKLGTNPAVDNKPPIEQEFLKLRRAITGTEDRLGLLQILPIIQRECHHILLPQIEIRNSDKLRRPVISKLPQAISMPGNVTLTDELYHMFDMSVERSCQTYENRLVKAYVQALRSRLSRLQAKLESEPAPPAIASQLRALIKEFNLACMRANFLTKVRLPAVFQGRITMVLLKNPAYRTILEDYLALNEQSSSVTLEEAALNAPLNEFPYLYQLWTNLRVLSAVLQVCAESGYRCVSHHWVKKYNKGVFIQMMNDGKAAIELSCPTTGRLVSLVPLRPGGSENALNTPGHEPPMALAIVIDTPKKPPVVLLFDPKYRVVCKSANQAVAEKTKTKKSKAAKSKAKKSKAKKSNTAESEKVEMVETLSTIEPMKEDIDELLRCIELVRAPEGVREIQYAAILYPGQRQQIAPDLEALPAHPSDGDGLEKIICDVLRRYLA